MWPSPAIHVLNYTVCVSSEFLFHCCICYGGIKCTFRSCMSVDFLELVIGNSRAFLSAALLFLRTCYRMDFESHVYTDDSKSESGVGFSVIFPSFCPGESLPNIICFYEKAFCCYPALGSFLTLPVSIFFTIFSDSHSVLSVV